jgi:hypothetical protein
MVYYYQKLLEITRQLCKRTFKNDKEHNRKAQANVEGIQEAKVIKCEGHIHAVLVIQ